MPPDPWLGANLSVPYTLAELEPNRRRTATHSIYELRTGSEWSAARSARPTYWSVTLSYLLLLTTVSVAASVPKFGLPQPNAAAQTETQRATTQLYLTSARISSFAAAAAAAAAVNSS